MVANCRLLALTVAAALALGGCAATAQQDAAKPAAPTQTAAAAGGAKAEPAQPHPTAPTDRAAKEAVPLERCLPVKFVAPTQTRVTLRPIRWGRFQGPPSEAEGYRVRELGAGSRHAVRVALPDGRALTGEIWVSKQASRERDGIVPIVISQSHVIKPALDEGREVTYVVYERKRDKTAAKPKRSLHSLYPDRGAQTTEAAPKAPPISPPKRTVPYGAKEWKRLVADQHYALRTVTPPVDAAPVRTEAEARRHLAAFDGTRTTTGGIDPVVLDEKQASATGGGYLFTFADPKNMSPLAQLDNLSSRAISPDVWKIAIRGANGNLRHLVGRKDNPVKCAKLRGDLVLVMKLHQAR